MRTIGIIIALIGLGSCSLQIRQTLRADYNWQNNYANHWYLADKSSTIEAKQKQIKLFVNSLEEGNRVGQFASHDALIYQTPNNDFRSNITALETLSQRLDEIKTMNPASWEYQTAIHQITEQEQGEAHDMLDVFRGSYRLAVYPWVWDYLGLLYGSIEFLVFAFGLGLFSYGNSYAYKYDRRIRASGNH
jgi:hypothetical protein